MTSSVTPRLLYTCAQMRELDRRAMAQYHLRDYELMCRAGHALFDVLLADNAPVHRVVCCCGGGNNGGDGWVLARLCHQNGIAVTVFSLVDPEVRLAGAAREAYEAFLSAGGACKPFEEAELLRADVIVDALYGTGLDREVSGEPRRWIEAINASGVRVVSADIPSGVNADTGAICGVAVRALQTVTFIGLKRGLFTGAGVDYIGQLHFADLGVTPRLATTDSVVTCLEPHELFRVLPPRARSMHKGKAGRVLIVGGAPGYAGAVMLAGQAALRGGAGLVTVATHPDSWVAIASHCAELMVHPVRQALALDALLTLVDCVLVGPGLGQSEWAQALFTTVLNSGKPLVLDADALNLLATAFPTLSANSPRTDWILTPHPGEASRLAGCTIAEIEADRFAAAQALSTRYQAVVALKGAGTVICDCKQNLWLCDRGNPGMATAGTGDVLAGLIAALCAQGLAAAEAARVGVLVHALAGDAAAAERGMRGLIASDLLPVIREKVNPCH